MNLNNNQIEEEKTEKEENKYEPQNEINNKR